MATTLIDDLKGVCANYGLGNDGNEFKIITQIFLYKFLNDKFAWEAKQIDPALAKAKSWEDALRAYTEPKYKMLLNRLGDGTAQLRPEHFLATLYGQQNDDPAHASGRHALHAGLRLLSRTEPRKIIRQAKFLRLAPGPSSLPR